MKLKNYFLEHFWMWFYYWSLFVCSMVNFISTKIVGELPYSEYDEWFTVDLLEICCVKVTNIHKNKCILVTWTLPIAIKRIFSVLQVQNFPRWMLKNCLLATEKFDETVFLINPVHPHTQIFVGFEVNGHRNCVPT